MQRFAFLWLTLCLHACNPVYSAQPIGEKPRNLTADKAEWEGTWAHGDGAVTVAVTDAEHGKLKVGWFEKSGESLRSYVFDIELRTYGKWTFANVKDPDKPRYTIARVERDGRQILLFQANTERWKALIAEKKIPGTLKPIKNAEGKTETEVMVGPLTARDLGFITADGRAALFDWARPTGFVKLTL